MPVRGCPHYWGSHGKRCPLEEGHEGDHDFSAYYRDAPLYARPQPLDVPPPPSFQHYWKCAHHTSALENFQANRTECIWECHTQKLESWHSGFHPMPKSWPAVRDRAGSLSAVRDLP